VIHLRGEKTVHDPVHGSMRVGGLVLDLMDTPELQRLRGIRQLGLAYMAFPGANHSRFEHSIGTAYLAGQIANELGLNQDEKNLLQASAVLHDVGHAPYSHTLEYLMTDYLGEDHMNITGSILQGKLNICSEDERKKLKKLGVQNASGVLKRWRVSAIDVSNLLLGRHRKRYLGELLHGEIDVDQMDYLLRDSLYTGVALGMVDMDRLMHTLIIHKGRVAVLSKGVEAVEGLLTARSLMYSSVYFHHTVRVAEMMLANAVDRALDMRGPINSSNFYLMNDSQLMEGLDAMSGYPADMVFRIKCRLLFKPVYIEDRRELTKTEKSKYLKRFGRWSQVKKIQNEIADEAGVERGYVILDAPMVDILISEPRLDKVEVPVLSDDGLSLLSDVSPIATALKRRQAPRYLLRVVADQKQADKVKKAAERVLG